LGEKLNFVTCLKKLKLDCCDYKTLKLINLKSLWLEFYVVDAEEEI